MAETDTAVRIVDEASVRALFARFNDRKAFFADPEDTWIDRPHYRVFAQDHEMRTREEVVAWFRGLFDAVPDLHMRSRTWRSLVNPTRARDGPLAHHGHVLGGPVRGH
jgi:hypothetical protein